MQSSHLGVADVETFARTRDAYIAEAAFFLEIAFVHRALAGKQAVLKTDEKDNREFQAFGRVQRHQLHAILAGAGLFIPRFE